MTKLLDNESSGGAGEELRKFITDGSRLSILTSAFSIWAYLHLESQLKQIEGLRLLLPYLGQLASSRDDTRFSIPGLIGDERDRHLRNSLQLAHAARACAKWLSENAEIRAVDSPVLQNLFCIENANGLSPTAVSGSATFTSSGLGFAPANGYDMSTLFDDSAQVHTLIKKFDSIWREHSAWDVKENVLSQLE